MGLRASRGLNLVWLRPAFVGGIVFSILVSSNAHPRIIKESSPENRTESVYTVTVDDTIGGILFRLGISPLWGKHGNVMKTLELNRDIIHDITDRIFPGTVLRLPISPEALELALNSPPPQPSIRKPAQVSEAPGQVDRRAPQVCEAPSAQVIYIVQAPTSGLTMPPLAAPMLQPAPQSTLTVNPIPASQSAATPPPPPPVAAEPVVAKPSKVILPDDTVSEFSVGASYGMTSFSAKDSVTGASANLQSMQDLLFSFMWVQRWSETILTFFDLDFRSVQFKPSNNPLIKIQGASQSPVQVKVGSEQGVTDKLSLVESLSYGQDLFMLGTSSRSLTIDTGFIASGEVGAKYYLFKRSRTQFGIKTSALYFLPASTDSYAISAGSGFTSGFFIERNYGKQNSISLSLGYSVRNQNTSFVEQSESSLFFGLVWKMPFLSGGDGK